MAASSLHRKMGKALRSIGRLRFKKPEASSPAKTHHRQEKRSVALRRFNFDPPSEALLKYIHRCRPKLKFKRTFKVMCHPGYAFWDDMGRKHIGMIMDKMHIGAVHIQLREVVKDKSGYPIRKKGGGFRVKDWVVLRKNVSLDPWDLDMSIGREEPPPVVRFKFDKLERYKRGGGQKTARGKRLTPQEVERQHREE